MKKKKGYVKDEQIKLEIILILPFEMIIIA